MEVSVFREFLATLFQEDALKHKAFFKRMELALQEVSSLEDIWGRLHVYWNPSLLEDVISRFCEEELRADMEDYRKALIQYRGQTRLRDFAESSLQLKQSLSGESFTQLTITLDERWDEAMLEDLDRLTEELCKHLDLPSYLVILQDVSRAADSIHVTWALPAEIGASLKENMENIEGTETREFCKGHGVRSMTVGGEECKYSPAKKYSAYLKHLYSHKEGKNLAPFTNGQE